MRELVLVAQATIDGDFSRPNETWNAFLMHVAHLPGVTLINSVRHDFPGGGFTGLILLAESHAAIHTWPEYNKAWIELATCGDPSALERFLLFDARVRMQRSATQ